MLQYKSVLQNEEKLHHEKFNSFERSKYRLDEFFFSTFEVHKNYEELSSVIKIILVLSHGQSAVERSFSLGKSFVVENIFEESFREVIGCRKYIGRVYNKQKNHERPYVSQ